MTGFDSETGQAIAVALAAAGARIAGCCRSAEAGQQSVRAVEAAGGQAVALTGSPAKIADAEKIVQGALERFGRLDVLVNYGAARRIVGTIMDITEEDFNEEMAADLKSVIFLSRYAIPAMIRQGGGSIVNLSSIAASGVKGRALRSASKAALNALTVAMALDHGPDNIRVNALLVGPTLTSDMKKRSDDIGPMEQQAALKKLHTPEDVAAAVVFLASEEARRLTGVLLPLDAGRSLPTF